MPGQVSQERDEPVDDEPAPYDPDSESYEGWVNRLEAAGYFPLPTSYPSDIYPHVSKIAQNKARRNLPEGYVLEYDLNWHNIIEPHQDDRGRNGRQFIFDLPQSNRPWKEKFVFIKFPTVSPLAGIKWSDHLLKPQYTEPAKAPDLEESLEKLLQGDPFTGQMFHYGAWIWRISPGGTGTPRADEAAGHGVPAPGNTAEARGSSHPEMNFRAFNIPTKKTGGSSSAAPRTVPVQQEPVEINSEEETPPTGHAGRTTVNPPLDKGKGRVRTKHAATTHPSAKRRRGESVPATESLEELWVKMGRKLKEMGEVGPETLGKLSKDSPSRSLQLEEKLKRLEAHNRELQDLTTRQHDEMANLSVVAGRANAEVLQLKEENSLLMGEVSHLKEEAWVKEQELPGRARQWMEENLVEAARVLTSSEERTMEGFKLLYREEQGKEMITQIGSYGFMCGQKRDREATHAILADRDPDFNAESYGLAPIPDEEPAPPFPLE
ncbi:unnamed protein product [Cuscuta campestris]|uniref:Uncharacterized protein n=1 Tax=Cuscuta campestris TaxID=132261 RepID=A0A484K7U6_9ASTE|nr:unnamed protein product [Cuscuta campestris]